MVVSQFLRLAAFKLRRTYSYQHALIRKNGFSFDLYFRKNPFGGEFTIFGGLEECIRFIANFKITEEEIKFLRSVMPTCEVGLLALSENLDLVMENSSYAQLKNTCSYIINMLIS